MAKATHSRYRDTLGYDDGLQHMVGTPLYNLSSSQQGLIIVITRDLEFATPCPADQFSYSQPIRPSALESSSRSQAAEDAPPCPADLNPPMMMFITVLAGD